MSNNIYAFVRFFKEEAHRESFIRGDLYMNRLQYFREYEESTGANIADMYEAPYAWFQGEGASITVAGDAPGEEHHITDMLGMAIFKQSYFHYHVYCMSALYLNDKDNFDSEEALYQKLLPFVDKGDLGEYCAVVPSKSFVMRMDKALADLSKAGTKSGHNLVEYYDPDTASVVFEGDKSILSKHLCYNHQREYRVYASDGSTGSESRIINIGDLSDIALRLGKHELRASIRLDRANHVMYIARPA
ncbi:hypothetical protein [Pseudomonas sp. NA-150]|uniref:hypothetical protein n=1 Tax=Pseudomonas sp. NA-150 TaxID=3367525 RepID=UPI0037CBBAF6